MSTRRPSKTLWGAFALALAAVFAPPAAADKLQVVATIPDLANIAEEIGGERVEVFSIARGSENIHAVRTKPSALIRVNRADLFLQVGLSLEHAYVPGLLEAGRNKRIQPGAPGFVNGSLGWEAVDVPEEISRGRAADIHPMGNPHINLSLRGGRFLAERVLEGLVRVDPEHAEEYTQRHAAYASRLAAAEKRWAEACERIAGTQVVAYHSEFRYFALETGLEQLGMIEARPGVPPTAADLARTIEVIRENKVPVILTPRWSNNDSVQFVAERSGARIVEVPDMVQREGEPDTWIELIDTLFARIEAALNEE